MELEQFRDEERSELSMIEVAHAILEETGEVYDFTRLLELIQDYLNMSEEQLEARMTRFYTDINIDGRFISLGENRWGLRSWYAIDEIDEEIINSMDDEDIPRHRRRKKKTTVNAFGEGDDDVIDYNDDDPEDIDDIYDVDEEELDDDEEEEAEDISVIDPVPADDEEDDDNEELGVYARDLDELGDEDLEEEEIDLDEADDFEEEDFDEEEDDLVVDEDKEEF